MQFKFWSGDGGVGEVLELRQTVAEQLEKNNKIKQRNSVLEAEVDDLKIGLESIENRARSELGMIKKNETFFHIIESQPEDIANK